MTLWESNAILVYLGEKHARLWPTNTTSRGAALRWLFFESCHLSDPIGTLWFSDFVAENAHVPHEEKAVAVQNRARLFGEVKKAEARAQLDSSCPWSSTISNTIPGCKGSASALWTVVTAHSLMR